MKLEGHAWQMLASKYITRPWLKDITRSDFVTFSEWILGEEVYMKKTSSSQGARRIKAPWSILMDFEYEARQKAFKMINEDGATMRDALEKVQHDADLMLSHFTTPLCIYLADQANKKSPVNHPPPQNLWEQRPFKFQKGDGKGKGKNKDKGKGKGKKNGGKKGGKDNRLVFKKGDREICFKFNKGQRCDAQCQRVHICQFKECADRGEKHPLSICEKAIAAGVQF